MSARKAFADYQVNSDSTRELEAMAEEVRRELNVRKRMYDRWLAEGKMTWAEGDSRMRALMGVLAVLNHIGPAELEALLPVQVGEKQQPSIL